MPVDDHAVPVKDSLDEVGRVEGAAVGEGGVGGGQLHRRCAVGHAAQRQREVPVPVVQRNADAFQVLAAVPDADGLQYLHRGDVQAVLERRADGDVAVVGVARVARPVAVEIGRFVEDDAGAGPPGVLDRRAYTASGLRAEPGWRRSWVARFSPRRV